MKHLFTLIIAILFFAQSYAQNKEQINYEQVKTQCSSLPLEKRARISVTRFNVTTTSVNDANVAQNANANNSLKALSLLSGNGGNTPRADEIPVTLGDNLAAMLTNALQGISCFRVLETLKNNADLTDEIDQNSSKYSSKRAPKAGRQLGPQIVATGEVVEYSIKSKGISTGFVNTKKKVVKIGFNLKLINTETRDIIFSRVIRVESTIGHKVDVGAAVYTPRFFASGAVSAGNEDPAIAAVLDDAILHSVQCLANVRDSLSITVDNIPGSMGHRSTGENEIEVSLNNASFSSFNEMASIIKSLPGFKSMEKSLSSGVGDYTVLHSGSPDGFLDALNKKLGNRYIVTGFTSDRIEMKVK